MGWFEENDPYSPGDRETPDPRQSRGPGRPTPANDARAQQIQAAYREFLGREADPQGLADYYYSTNNLTDIYYDLYRSAEGQAYQAKKQAAPPQDTTPKPDTTPPGPEGGDYRTWFMKLVAGKPWNQQTLLDLEPTLTKYGFHITPPNKAGQRTKIQLPTGEWVRVGFAEGSPVWITQGPAGEGAPFATPAAAPAMAGGGPGLAALSAATGSLVTPFTDKFSYPAFTQPEPFTEAFSYPEFQAPTSAQAMADPGIQFQLAEGQKAIERSAAAGGTLLTGGTLRDLSRESQGIAATGYGDVWQRAFQGYGANLNKALATYGSRRDVNQDVYGRARDLWSTNYQKARNEFDLARDIFMANQDRPFTKLRSLAELGRF